MNVPFIRTFIGSLVVCTTLSSCSLFQTREEQNIAFKCTDISNVIGKNYKIGLGANYLLVGGHANFERSGVILSSEASERQINMDRFCRQWARREITTEQWISISTQIAVASGVAASRNPDPNITEEINKNLEELQVHLLKLAEERERGRSTVHVPSLAELINAVSVEQAKSDKTISEQLKSAVEALNKRIDSSSQDVLNTYKSALDDNKLLNQELMRTVVSLKQQLESMSKCNTLSEAVLARQPSQVAKIRFALGSSDLSSEAQAQLRSALPPRLDEESKYRIELNGYTDVTGAASSNAALSLARAQSVRDFLVDELKLESANITTYGRRGGVSRFGHDLVSNRIVELKLFKR